VSDLGVVLVFGEAQELENDVQGEEKSHDVFQPEDPVVANVEHDRSEVHRREAGVDDNDEHKSIPKVEEWMPRAPLHLILEAELNLRASITNSAFTGALTAKILTAAAKQLLILLSLFALIELLLHVSGAVDQHRLSLLSPLFLLSQVFDD